MKTIITFIAVILITLTSCEKEESVTPTFPSLEQQSPVDAEKYPLGGFWIHDSSIVGMYCGYIAGDIEVDSTCFHTTFGTMFCTITPDSIREIRINEGENGVSSYKSTIVDSLNYIVRSSWGEDKIFKVTGEVLVISEVNGSSLRYYHKASPEEKEKYLEMYTTNKEIAYYYHK